MYKDTFEVDNKIDSKKYKKKIANLKTYYNDLVDNNPSTDKDLLIQNQLR